MPTVYCMLRQHWNWLFIIQCILKPHESVMRGIVQPNGPRKTDAAMHTFNSWELKLYERQGIGRKKKNQCAMCLFTLAFYVSTGCPVSIRFFTCYFFFFNIRREWNIAGKHEINASILCFFCIPHVWRRCAINHGKLPNWLGSPQRGVSTID